MFLTIFVAFVAFILAYIFALSILRNRGRVVPTKNKHTAVLNKVFIQKKWLEIEGTYKLGGPSHVKSSIIEADKLVDYVLKARGVNGETMGQRLKNAKSIFEGYSDYENLWFAHKVRNNIAHESEHDLATVEAKRAMEYFEQALKALGALPW